MDLAIMREMGWNYDSLMAAPVEYVERIWDHIQARIEAQANAN